ncbi:MAG: carboxypeptidase regulatory-like domain-containing protein, partial [Terriglobia bacterium]
MKAFTLRKGKLIALLSTGLLLAAIAAYGQVVNGIIVGTVTDTSGAVIPQAKVTVTDIGTGVNRVLTTDSSGYYSVPNLPPGTYKVSAAKQGFTTGVHTGVALFAASTVRVDLTLPPGSVTQTVTVNAGIVPMLQTDTAHTGRTITAALVEQLPLTTGRNFQNLLNLIPGAGVAVRDHSLAFNPQNSMASTVDGNSSLGNLFNSEGINDHERSTLLQMYFTAAEAIQEVSITASNYDPAQGTALGAVTNVILKSGTNAFHGEAYEFYQSSSLNARSFFELGPNGAPFHVPHLVDNYYGGNVGGPIQKGKTFFFVDYLQRATREGEALQLSVPTAAMRNGDFSDPALTPVFDPTTGDTADCLGLSGGNSKLCGTGRQQFANNIIPANRLDPVAAKILSNVALPNTNQTAPGNAKYVSNLVTSSEFIQNTPDLDVKIDRYQGQKDHISGRFSYTKPTLDQPGLYGAYGGPISGGGISGLEGTGSQKTYSTGINWVHVFSPTLVSEARIGLSRWFNVAYGTGYGQDLSTEVGIPGASINKYTSGVVGISGEGFSDPFVGTESDLPWTRAGDNIE